MVDLSREIVPVILSVNDMGLYQLCLCLNDPFKAVEPRLELLAITRSEARLLALLVLADLAVASAPATTWLSAV